MTNLPSVAVVYYCNTNVANCVAMTAEAGFFSLPLYINVRWKSNKVGFWGRDWVVPHHEKCGRSGVQVDLRSVFGVFVTIDYLHSAPVFKELSKVCSSIQ